MGFRSKMNPVCQFLWTALIMAPVCLRCQHYCNFAYVTYFRFYSYLVVTSMLEPLQWLGLRRPVDVPRERVCPSAQMRRSLTAGSYQDGTSLAQERPGQHDYGSLGKRVEYSWDC
jgi:hypothetical protein